MRKSFIAVFFVAMVAITIVKGESVVFIEGDVSLEGSGVIVLGVRGLTGILVIEASVFEGDPMLVIQGMEGISRIEVVGNGIVGMEGCTYSRNVQRVFSDHGIINKGSSRVFVATEDG